MVRKLTCFVFSFLLFFQSLYSQSGISGRIFIDTSIWAPVAYISLIPDLDNMYTMSDDIIIDKGVIDESGNFKFNTTYLPERDVLIRLHISKKGDMPASLIIGGKDENHFFFVANKSAAVIIEDTGKTEFVKDVLLKGYKPNLTLRSVDIVANYLDTADFDGPLIKTELIRSAIFEKLRAIADTCSNPLVSLYALYKSKFDRNYPVNQQFYGNFLAKWKQPDDPYFIEFRKKLPQTRSNITSYLLVILISLLVGFLASTGYIKFFRKKKNLLRDLSVQERKIFSLLLEGKSNKEISETMMIGMSTVKSHVTSIYSKLQVNSRKALMNLETKDKMH